MPRVITRLALLGGALLSGGLLALAGGLHPSWAAAWIASVPVLVAGFKSTGRGALALGLLSGLVGGTSVLGYYATVLTMPVALVILVLQAIVYAGGVRLAWGARRRLPDLLSVFALPCWFAAFDLLVAAFSANGTAGSPAYSQMNFPPVLQVASLGGVPAVTFVVYLFSSILAHVIAGVGPRMRRLIVVAPALLVVAACVGLGNWRISTAPAEPKILVAAAALDQKSALPDDWHAAVEAYRPLLAQARDRHVGVMVLPEEIALVSADDLQAIQADLGSLARLSEMSLAVGFRVADATKLRNVLLLFTPDGRALSYDKQHLIPGLEFPRITPGTSPALIAEVGGHRLGGAICKDFDFVDVSRSLGAGRAGLVLAPAWDFREDGWLHGRMAMLRGVEGGFTLVRAAREGTMSVSDRYGRVLAEAPSGPTAPLLVTQAPVPTSGPTIYAQVGDVFGWACVGLLLLLMASALSSQHRKV